MKGLELMMHVINYKEGNMRTYVLYMYYDDEKQIKVRN